MRYLYTLMVVGLVILLALPPCECANASAQELCVPGGVSRFHSQNDVVDFSVDPLLSVRSQAPLSAQRKALLLTWYHQVLPQLFKALDWNKHRLNGNAELRFAFTNGFCTLERCRVLDAEKAYEQTVFGDSINSALERMNGRHGFKPPLPADVVAVSVNGHLSVNQEKHPAMTFPGAADTQSLRTYRLRVLRNLRKGWDDPGGKVERIYVDLDIDGGGAVHNVKFSPGAPPRERNAAFKALKESTPFWVPPEGTPTPLKARIEFPPF